MAKETAKGKIGRLENEVEKLNQIISQNIAVIHEMQDKANDVFANSTDKQQLEQRIFILEKLLKSEEHRRELAETKASRRDKQIQELKNGKPNNKHNERGAGRKEILTDKEKETIKMYRLQGKTIKEIAELYSCSVGLIHKIVKE